MQKKYITIQRTDLDVLTEVVNGYASDGYKVIGVYLVMSHHPDVDPQALHVVWMELSER